MAEACRARDQCADFLGGVAALVAAQKRTKHAVPAGAGDTCDMPATCGPAAWALLHGLFQAFNDHVCSKCGAVGIALATAMHDAVNAKLGKPLHDAANYDDVLRMMTAARPNAGSGVALEAVGYSALHDKPGKRTEVGAMRKLNEQVRQLRTDVEVGAPICQAGGRVFLGPMVTGDENSVDVPLDCGPGAEAIATLHSHPGGPLEPSEQDLAEGRRLRLQGVCIADPVTGEVGCRRL